MTITEFLPKLNSKSLEPDRTQRDRTAACVIAQQYSSGTFVSFPLRSRKEIFVVRFKKLSFLSFSTQF